MRIATYIINDIRKRLAPLRAWVDVTSPDVLCLHELKCTEADFPFDVLRADGYEALVVGQKAWNGVAITSKGTAPIEIRRKLPGNASDKQARYLEAVVDGIVARGSCCSNALTLKDRIAQLASASPSQAQTTGALLDYRQLALAHGERPLATPPSQSSAHCEWIGA